MSSDPNDKGVRKFRGMIITQAFLFAGFLVAGWRGWLDLFEILAWGVVGSFLSFAVPNVAEKILQRFPSKKPPAP